MKPLLTEWSHRKGFVELMTQSGGISLGLIICAFVGAYIFLQWRSDVKWKSNQVAADYACDIVYRLFQATQADEDFRKEVNLKISDESLVRSGDRRVGIDQAYQLCIPPNRDFQAVILPK